MKIRKLLSLTRSKTVSVFVGLIIVVAYLWLFILVMVGPKSTNPAPVEQIGIPTEAQARRGGDLYARTCASCHGMQLQGTPASALAGDQFMAKWGQGNHYVDELYYITKTQMPYGAPNTLPP
ncbi:MAG TPA: c-type cytochrome, partial [Blastocatellia bacterium]